MQRDPEIFQGRRPRNATQAQFFDLAAEAGWALSTRGWPDYFLKLGNSVCCVEVKPASTRNFRPEQVRVLAALVGAGIPCFCWSPDGGLEKVTVGDKGVQLVVVDVEVKELLDVIEGESEGKHGEPRPAPVAGFPAPADPADPLPSPAKPATAMQIAQVEAAYIETMKPRNPLLHEDDRAIIRKALVAASPEELILAIRTCERSDYHMKRGQHLNRKGGKYNSIGKILKPRPRNGETQRSRIEWWLDRAEELGAAPIPSADPAIIQQKQLEVRRGLASNDAEMVAKAETAKTWLAERGIKTVVADDGSPTFERAPR